ncbi:hypothetical protein Tco_0496215 [Tanacetum coccineum]
MHELETCSFPARFGEVQLSLVGGSGDLKDLADSSPMEVRSWRPKQDTPKADAPVICIWERGNLLRGMNQVGKYDAAGRELDVVVGQAVYAVEGRAILDMPRMRSWLYLYPPDLLYSVPADQSSELRSRLRRLVVVEVGDDWSPEDREQVHHRLGLAQYWSFLVRLPVTFSTKELICKAKILFEVFIEDWLQWR